MDRNDYNRAALYYDAWAAPYDDASFYRSLLPSAQADMLELGCGAGRVLLPMTKDCRFIQGIDLSESMLEICRNKLEAAELDPKQAQVDQGDITNLDLGRTFDLITAPFRVMQNLETDAQVAGLLSTIRCHLAPGGTAVLNTFCPRGAPEATKAFWSSRDGSDYSEKQTPLGLLRSRDDCRRFQDDPLMVFPVLYYDRVVDDRVVDTAELPIAMRVWYPDALLKLVTDAGFQITGRFGGYDGETWGEGPELVVAFTTHQ